MTHQAKVRRAGGRGAVSVDMGLSLTDCRLQTADGGLNDRRSSPFSLDAECDANALRSPSRLNVTVHSRVNLQPAISTLQSGSLVLLLRRDRLQDHLDLGPVL